MITSNNIQPGQPPFKIISAILLIITFLIMSLLFGSCGGCKKQPEPVQPSVPQVIENSYKPKADSLELVVKKLSDSIGQLKKQVAKASEDRKILRQLLNKANAGVAEAIESGDTVDIINSLQAAVISYEDYIIQSDKELKLQGKIIERQDSLISTSFAESELQKSKFKTLADEYRKLDAQYTLQTNKLARTEKRLRRAKWVNSVAVPAVVVGGTSIIAPPYTLPAVGVAMALHFILKPKKK